jgi:hypothetical protein
LKLEDLVDFIQGKIEGRIKEIDNENIRKNSTNSKGEK